MHQMIETTLHHNQSMWLGDFNIDSAMPGGLDIQERMCFLAGTQYMTEQKGYMVYL